MDGLTAGGWRGRAVHHHLVQLAIPAGGHEAAVVVDHVRVVRLDRPVRVYAVWRQEFDRVGMEFLCVLQWKMDTEIRGLHRALRRLMQNVLQGLALIDKMFLRILHQ